LVSVSPLTSLVYSQAVRNLVIASIAASLFLFVAAALGTSSAIPSDESRTEQNFDALIAPNDLRDWMKVLASEPNHVGSPHDKANAERILAWFKDWGWDAHIETFYILYPTPIKETLELVTPKSFKATLQEPPIPGDSSATAREPALPAYLVYQSDGDVTAGLVYVNYGMKDDYDTLERLGVSVKGKIVIARYGGGWRGLKPKLAAEHGAIGCIIYSDPANDGYSIDNVYPEGPMRPYYGIQRGSVLDISLYPGDPLTPGVGSTKDAKRISIAEAKSLVRIPAIPISYGDAKVFLESLQGPVAPATWRGTLPITYHVGPGPSVAHLAVKSDWGSKEIYDVIATMKGSTYPDQWVIRGNHHDGWVFGATDPLAGQVALLAEAKAMGALAKGGWRPKRTIVYTSWDAEEAMLIGSTEWAETHGPELRQKALIYINSDTNARGYLQAGGSQDFQHLVNQVAADVTDPETQVSIAERRRAKLRVAALEAGATERVKAEAKVAADPAKDFLIEPLGSGSDFSAFLDHLGVPSLDLAFAGEGDFRGVYHSRYDTFEHHTRFVDPGFVYDALLAKTIGRLVLRACDSDLPLQRASDFADAMSTNLDLEKKLLKQKREEAETQDKMLRDHAYHIAADPTQSNAPPTRLSAVPQVNFKPLDDAVNRLKGSARAYDDALAKHGPNLSAPELAQLNAMMLTIDRTLAPDAGLPDRPWYKNVIYAPGRFTGYDAKTMPAITEAIEDSRWADVDRGVKITADSLNTYSDQLDQATAILNGASTVSR
jgi:N-acetylated-alpha-linked acidic dipeptidase